MDCSKRILDFNEDYNYFSEKKNLLPGQPGKVFKPDSIYLLIMETYFP
jgi:hypothetical protein